MRRRQLGRGRKRKGEKRAEQKEEKISNRKWLRKRRRLRKAFFGCLPPFSPIPFLSRSFHALSFFSSIPSLASLAIIGVTERMKEGKKDERTEEGRDREETG